MAPPASTVQVYVCDFNGIAQLVEVPVGTTLMKLVRVALQEPGFKEGDFLGFEDRNLAQDQLVTAADATRWTAEKPLELKYKVRTRKQNNIRAMDTELEAKVSKFTTRHIGWIIGAANFGYTTWTWFHPGHASSGDRSGSGMGW
ncbi:hypothetical protein DVH05_002796 [Phytophthora capsici]|nr:hypothetical protein DVH05_002796 [Phytophthora capsici]